MTVEEAIALTNTILQPRHLSNVQNLVFHLCWEGKSYSQIAAISDYSFDYLREVGSQIWLLLSEVLGKKVTKNNLRSVLTQYQFSTKPIQNSNLEPKDRFTNPQSTFNIQSDLFTTTEFADWGDAIDVSFFYGRDLELAILEQWILGNSDPETPNKPCRMISLLGIERIGKTSLAVKISQQVQHRFDFLIWRSLRNAPPIENILIQWIQFLSYRQEIIIPRTLDDQIICLLHYLRISRCLLVLDNFDPILQSGDMRGHYRDGYEGYGQLLRSIRDTSHQSCLIFTSREKPIGLDAKECKMLTLRSMT